VAVCSSQRLGLDDIGLAVREAWLYEKSSFADNFVAQRLGFLTPDAGWLAAP
jgi:hypothetical protein